MNSTTSDRLVPFALAVPFTATITGFFNLSESLSIPVGLAAGAGWGVALGLIMTLIREKRVLGAWVEDAFVFLATLAAAFAACGGLMALLMLNGALDSSSLTGETLEATFLPTIPYYIAANGVLELLLIPGLLVLGWRAGRRRLLIVLAAGLYFVLRVWTYVAFRPARLGFADADNTAVPLTATERHQAYVDLKLDDPRWILLLVIFVFFFLAARLPRLSESTARRAISRATSG
jgi:hypothetical protein